MAVLLTDYFIISKGYFQINGLYSTSRSGLYWYTYGVNPRAFVAYLVGVAVNFYGFLGNLGADDVGIATTRSYYFAIFTTTTAAALVYFALSKVFPTQHANGGWSEPRGLWEPEDGQPGRVKPAAVASRSDSFDKTGTGAGVVEMARSDSGLSSTDEEKDKEALGSPKSQVIDV